METLDTHNPTLKRKLDHIIQDLNEYNESVQDPKQRVKLNVESEAENGDTNGKVHIPNLNGKVPSDYPTLEDLKAAGVEDPEFVLQIQEKAYAAYSKSLGYHKGKRSFINGYPIKPNAIETGFKKYQDMIVQKGDDRNDYLYGELKDKLRENIAFLIGSKRPEDIALGINATTFVVQILTHYWGAPLKVLTTNEEFYGTVRVLSRLKEVEGVTITEVKTEPFETYTERWLEEASKEKYDVAILSHIPFKSANVIADMQDFIPKLKEKVNKIVIDGSSAFGNLPIDLILGPAIDDVYYIGGIYKFMGAGEGFAFMSLPKDCKDRPVLTGWVFGDYTDESHYYSKPLYYAEDGDRYANSTLECSVWMRVVEIMEYFKRENYTVEMKNRYTTILKDYMIRKIDEANISFISSRNLLSKFGKWRPLQTCFELANEKITSKEVVKRVNEFNVDADFRGTILRLCPATYHTIFDIDFLVAKLKEIDNTL